MTNMSQTLLRDRLAVALMAAVMAAISPFAISVGPIPLSFGLLGVYFCASLLGGKRGTMAVGLYLLLGGIGAPVFTGFTGGLQKFVGPTGGYLLGYLLCAALAGWLISRFGDGRPAVWVVALLLGTALLYLFGTVWYLWSSGSTWPAAVSACILPFLPGDAAKILVTVAAGYPLKAVLRRRGYLGTS